jgi:hypothetical protein
MTGGWRDDVLAPHRIVTRKKERVALGRKKKRVRAVLERARRERASLGEPERWLHTKTYALSATPRTEREWIALRRGDVLRYSFPFAPVGRHLMLYIGDGIVLGMVQYRRGRGHILVEDIESDLFAPTANAPTRTRKKPTLVKWTEQCTSLTNRKRLDRIERAMDSMATYRYHLTRFNCQHLCMWWVNGSAQLCSPCVERSKWLGPLLAAVLFVLLFAFGTWLVRRQNKKGNGIH